MSTPAWVQRAGFVSGACPSGTCLDRTACVDDLLATHKAIGGVHGNRAHCVVSDVLGNLEHQAHVVALHLQGTLDRWELAIEAHIDHGPDHLRKCVEPIL